MKTYAINEFYALKHKGKIKNKFVIKLWNGTFSEVTWIGDNGVELPICFASQFNYEMMIHEAKYHGRKDIIMMDADRIEDSQKRQKGGKINE